MKKSIVSVLLGTTLMVPGIAFAQDAAEAVDANDGGIDEIVVTAQKRSEGISRVPISIAAVSGESVEAYGQANLEQVASSIPNLRINQTGIANRIAIRGVSSGDNKGFEQSAAMFVDGIYYGRDQLSRMPLVDIERVEVLRGPQPTLFGKNAIAGAISVISRKPTNNFEGSFSALAEFNHGETQLTGVLSGPISDGIGVRVVGYYRGMNGYMFNTWMDRNEPNSSTFFGRFSLSLDKGGPLTADLKLEYADFKTFGSPRESFSPVGTYSAVFTGPLAVETNLDWRREDNGTSSRNKTFNAVLSLNLELGSHTLTSVSGFLNYKTDEVLDVDFTKISFLDGTNQGERYDQYSQELRLTSPSEGPFKYIIGGYFQHSKLDAFDHVLFNRFFQTLGAPFSRIGDATNDRTFSQSSTLWSGFAQGTYSLTDKLRITAGVRINTEHKTGSRVLAINAGPTNTGVGIALPPSAIYPVGNNAMLATFAVLKIVAHSIDDEFTETSTTPLVNVQYDLTNNLMLYGSYARGAKAGGFDIRSNSLPTTPGVPGAFRFAPEKADNFEGGLKFKNRSMAFNISYFNTSYKDLQVNIFDGSLSFNVRNAASVKVQGVEADGRVKLSRNFTLSGAVAYLDYKFTDFKQGQCPFGVPSNVAGGYCDYTGQTGQLAPKWSGNANFDAVFPISSGLQISANVNVDFSSSYSAGNILEPRTNQDGYAKLGARLALGEIDGGWEVALIGRNLTDERILQTGGPLPLSSTLTGGRGTAFTGIFERPRSIAIQINGSF